MCEVQFTNAHSAAGFTFLEIDTGISKETENLQIAILVFSYLKDFTQSAMAPAGLQSWEWYGGRSYIKVSTLSTSLG